MSTYLSFLPIGVPASGRLVFRPIYPQPVVLDTGAGSGKYKRRRFECEEDVFLYLDGLRDEFRALKAQAVHVDDLVSPDDPDKNPEDTFAGSTIDSINEDLKALERMEDLNASCAKRLALLGRAVEKIAALEAEIREEEEWLLLN